MSHLQACSRALPVLFLDLDDVLCLNDSYGGFAAIEALNGRHHNPAAVFRKVFAARPSQVLSRTHESMGGELRYVISSTWRESFRREQMYELFRRAGLEFVANALHEGERWRTTVKLRRLRRVDEIAAWLDRFHQGEPFAIVDDVLSGASLLPALTLPDHPFVGRIVLCEEKVGLTDEHMQTIVDALQRPIGVPDESEVRKIEGEGVR